MTCVAVTRTLHATPLEALLLLLLLMLLLLL